MLYRNVMRLIIKNVCALQNDTQFIGLVRINSLLVDTGQYLEDIYSVSTNIDIISTDNYSISS